VMGALFEPNDFACAGSMAAGAGLAAGLADVFVCGRADTAEVAANATAKRKVPIRLARSGFTRCSP